MEFTDEEKIWLAQKIIDGYFQNNFGSMSKMDMETLIFSVYMKHCQENNAPCDDYTLSKQLGITQNRVRTFKERVGLRFPELISNDWRNAFAIAVRKAKYDKTDHYIKINIEDVNVMNEVRHYIEMQGWYDECSLNRKLLRIPLDCLVEICFKDASLNEIFSEETKREIRKLKLNESALKELMEDFTKEGFKNFLGSSSKELILEILPKLPLKGIGKITIDGLCTALSSK